MTTPTPTPADPVEAEKLAAQIVGEYLNACRLAAGENEREMIGDYLMKLVSVTGIVMAQAEGSVTAAKRLIGTAHFIEREMPRLPAQIARMQ